jgi:hypothetical protein
VIIGHVDKSPRYIQACFIYAEVLEMAAILDRADNYLLARIHSEWKFRNGRHTMAGAIVGAPRSATLVDYFRLCNSWCSADLTDSVRNAQAFLEIRLCISSRIRVK